MANGGMNGEAINGHQKSPEPGLEEKLHVNRSSEAFSSYASSKVSLPAGSVFSRITVATPGKKAYTSVQTSENTHIELNSDLVFCNHSCDPSLVFDMSKMEVRVVDDRDLKEGDALTFFYPSSEWDMDQPFDCHCKTSKCCGRISGARDMDVEVLRRYWLNPHIEQLLSKKKAAGVSQ
ncbi:galactose-proton symport [Cystobasidium minutum MCA 4210]|uniref:galactose-proton symport n=1 Tax=Cystobasidium minutum MCA 4210 TaxID=1397322 RepID=UPI0034CD9E5B|eukprot:jgi/Rhomi1/4962/CE4961_28578